MSTLGIVLIAIGGVLLVLFLGGLVISARRRDRPSTTRAIEAADRALAQAAAADRGWDRDLLHEAARSALAAARPEFEVSSLELVLVDDRPGVVEDRAHLVAAGTSDRVLIVLARDEQGAWLLERLE
jgi:hypothetical protein